jgi:mono/diheme cytochrome c family protein
MKLKLLWIAALSIGALLLITCGCKMKVDPSGRTRYYAGADSVSYEARLGRETWNHYCALCHGPQGKGDGFNAYNLNPHPRNLSDPAFQESLDDNRLKEIIRYGGTLRGGSPRMPGWGGTLNDQELTRLVKFIRTLKKSAVNKSQK